MHNRWLICKERFLLQFHDLTCIYLKPRFRKSNTSFFIGKLPMLNNSRFKKEYSNDKSEEAASSNLAKQQGNLINEPIISDPTYINLPEELFRFAEAGVYPTITFNASSNTVSKSEKPKEFRYKLPDILTAAGLLNLNNSFNGNECICKQVGSQNASEITRQCCCSKDMQQKCEGVDLSYLLPIPGDTTTAKITTTSHQHKVKSLSATTAVTASCSMASVKNCPNINSPHNGRDYRKAEDSTLDALRRFQLTHGIFAPNEEEMEKAVERSKIQISKIKNKVPVWMKHLNQVGDLSKSTKDNFNGKIANNEENELYKFLPRFKIEKIIGEEKSAVKTRPEYNSQQNDIPLLYQNAAAIKKQLETIRQYDILLANIRAQAQLKLIELADMEGKHRVEEIRYKKQREHGLEELKNMEEVLRQEVKLAQNLPVVASWNNIHDSVDTKLYNNNNNNYNQNLLLDFMNQNADSFERPQNIEIIQESVNRNSKLLDELDSLLRDSDNFATNLKNSNILIKHDVKNIADNKPSDNYSFLEKALGKTFRNNQKPSNTYISLYDRISNDSSRFKRKCFTSLPSSTKTEGETKSVSLSSYDKAFHNLQNDLTELKDFLLKHSKYTTEDNVLVQIKLSVDVANSTEPSGTIKREISESDNKKHKKIDIFKSSN